MKDRYDTLREFEYILDDNVGRCIMIGETNSEKDLRTILLNCDTGEIILESKNGRRI